MKQEPAGIVEGARPMGEAIQARRTRFGIKTQNAEAAEAIGAQFKDGAMDTILLGGFYPSGDEYEVVYSATGRLIPPAGIPLNVGCVLNNLETLYNMSRAADGHAVTPPCLNRLLRQGYYDGATMYNRRTRRKRNWQA